MKNRVRKEPAQYPSLDELLTEVDPAEEVVSPFVGEVLDSRHPTLVGRVLVGWQLGNGGRVERWLPALQGLALREADRVIVTKPQNWAEHVVTGVIDGFASRPEVPRCGPSVALLPDESLKVTDSAGRALVEVLPTASGPVIRLLNEDVEVEFEGRLKLVARELELVARDGAARLIAEGDVVVRGDSVQLN